MPNKGEWVGMEVLDSHGTILYRSLYSIQDLIGEVVLVDALDDSIATALHRLSYIGVDTNACSVCLYLLDEHMSTIDRVRW